MLKLDPQDAHLATRADPEGRIDGLPASWLILGRSDVWHRNGDPLDCRRANLSVRGPDEIVVIDTATGLRYRASCDPLDYVRLRKLPWRVLWAKGLPYLRTTLGKHRGQVYASKLVASWLTERPLHKVRFADGDTLNLRRSNLVITPDAEVIQDSPGSGPKGTVIQICERRYLVDPEDVPKVMAVHWLGQRSVAGASLKEILGKTPEGRDYRRDKSALKPIAFWGSPKEVA